MRKECELSGRLGMVVLLAILVAVTSAVSWAQQCNIGYNNLGYITSAWCGLSPYCDAEKDQCEFDECNSNCGYGYLFYCVSLNYECGFFPGCNGRECI
jgi:hypothetical protein